MRDFQGTPKDRTAYRAWQKQERGRERTPCVEPSMTRPTSGLARVAKEPVSPTLEADFRWMHQLYWTARRTWAAELSRSDTSLPPVSYAW